MSWCARYRCLSCHQIEGSRRRHLHRAAHREGSKVKESGSRHYLLLPTTVRPILTDRMLPLAMSDASARRFLADVDRQRLRRRRHPGEIFAGRPAPTRPSAASASTTSATAAVPAIRSRQPGATGPPPRRRAGQAPPGGSPGGWRGRSVGAPTALPQRRAWTPPTPATWPPIWSPAARRSPARSSARSARRALARPPRGPPVGMPRGRPLRPGSIDRRPPAAERPRPTPAAAPCDGGRRRCLEQRARGRGFSLRSTCHGDDGHGDGFNAYNLDPRPRDLADPAFQAAHSDAELTGVIRSGGPAAGPCQRHARLGSNALGAPHPRTGNLSADSEARGELSSPRRTSRNSASSRASRRRLTGELNSAPATTGARPPAGSERPAGRSPPRRRRGAAGGELLGHPPRRREHRLGRRSRRPLPVALRLRPAPAPPRHLGEEVRRRRRRHVRRREEGPGEPPVAGEIGLHLLPAQPGFRQDPLRRPLGRPTRLEEVHLHPAVGVDGAVAGRLDRQEDRLG